MSINKSHKCKLFCTLYDLVFSVFLGYYILCSFTYDMRQQRAKITQGTSLSHLSVATWNIQGLIGTTFNKLKDSSFIAEVRKHHIIGLTETHGLPEDNITLSGYQAFHICRQKSGQKRHGGIAFLVKKEIKQGVKFLSSETRDIAWAILSKDFFGIEQDLYIGLVYFSPVNSSYAKKLEYNPFDQLLADIEKYSDSGRVIIMGDFNARTGSLNDQMPTDRCDKHIPVMDILDADDNVSRRLSQDKQKVCTYGNRLIELCVASNMRIANGRVLGDTVGKLTCHKYNGSSVVDYVLADNVMLPQIRYLQVSDFIGDISDHCLVSFGLAVHAKTLTPKPTGSPLAKTFRWRKGAEPLIQKAIATHPSLSKLLDNEMSDIHEEVEALNNLITQAAAKYLVKGSSSKKVKNKKWFDRPCYILRKEVKKLSKALATNPLSTNIRAAFNATKRRYRIQRRIARRDYKAKITEALNESQNSNPKRYWKLLRDLKNIDQIADEEINPIAEETWFEHYTKLLAPHLNNNEDEQIINELEEKEKQPEFNTLSYTIKTHEIHSAINELKIGKAAGPDGISSEIIKACAPVITPVLDKMFNKILTTGNYPKLWGEGVITSIHKKGDRLDPGNYRGITISSSIAKVFGLVLRRRLTTFCETENLIDERQSSHRKGSRTTDNVFLLKTLWEKYCKSQNQPLYVGFIDFKKAFDSVWHEALMLKLQRSGISKHFYNTLKHMYQNIECTVKCNNGTQSMPFPVKRGVRQGDVLSPLLFNLFLNDIVPLLQEESSTPPKLINTVVGCLLYADDLMILSTTAEGLQNSLNKLNRYCTTWKLDINLEKSKIMCMSKGGRSKDKDFHLGDSEIKCTHSYTYLGVEISKSGSAKQAQHALYKKALRAWFKLRQLVIGSDLPPQTIINMFDQLVKPVALYGAEVWGADLLNTGSIEKLMESMKKFSCEKLNLSLSRFALGVHKKAQNTAVQGELGRYPLAIDIIGAITSYMRYLESKGNNSLLKEALELNKKMAGHSNGTNSLWFNKCKQLTKLITTEHKSTAPAKTIRKQTMSKLKSLYNEFWKENITKQPKMRTYINIKERFNLEAYLTSIKNQKHRCAMAKLRISAHNLAIERGRYARPPIPPEQRVCTFCPNEPIEDEMHFLTTCKKYHTDREKLYREINEMSKNFKNLPNTEKFFFMLTAEDNIASAVAKFIYDHMP